MNSSPKIRQLKETSTNSAQRHKTSLRSGESVVFYLHPPMLKHLESYFEFTHLGTNWRTEILAGVTTFLTMAYIVLVNPAILSATGVPLAAVTAATCLSAAFGSILMGIVARYPIALAPGMGLNAYFTYTVCLKMHIPWQTALGAVFLSGVIFLALTAAGIRQMILRSIPHELYAAVASGIGLFIAFIGFRNAGLVVSDPATLVGLGNIRNPTAALALFGLILMVALEVRKVRGSILIGVLDHHRHRLGARPRPLDTAPPAAFKPSPPLHSNSTSAARSTRACSKSSSSSSSSTSSTTSAPSSPSPSAPASSPPITPFPASTASCSPTPPPPSSAP